MYAMLYTHSLLRDGCTSEHLCLLLRQHGLFPSLYVSPSVSSQQHKTKISLHHAFFKRNMRARWDKVMIALLLPIFMKLTRDIKMMEISILQIKKRQECARTKTREKRRKELHGCDEPYETTAVTYCTV